MVDEIPKIDSQLRIERYLHVDKNISFKITNTS
jgi:hypothetical protein